MAAAARDLEKLSPEPTPAEAERGNLALELLRHPAVRRLGDGVAPAPDTVPEWSCKELSGRLCELSGGAAAASLTAAFSLVLDAQLQGEPVAWVTSRAATFHPPDAAAWGVDLAALVVVRAKDARGAGRAADVLLRSGAYGLVVLELGTSATLPTPLQGRLVQLAQKHDAAVVCLTDKPPTAPSLGSLVSLRGESMRRRTSRDSTGDEGFACHLRVLKDKRRGPGWTWRGVHRGPEGLH
ncbi:MAG: recombinase A [bacterium]|nr:recombinase A [bacterium]